MRQKKVKPQKRNISVYLSIDEYKKMSEFMRKGYNRTRAVRRAIFETELKSLSVAEIDDFIEGLKKITALWNNIVSFVKREEVAKTL